MAIQTYSTVDGRVNEVIGEMIGHALPHEVLGITGDNKSMPKNKGDNISFRAVLPYGAASTNANTINRPSVTVSAHVTTEGVTPSPDSIAYRDVNVSLTQYMVLYGYTDKAAELYEDDIPGDMKQQTGERIGLLREMIRYGVLKAGTNAYYSGGTSRATVDEPVTYNFLSKISRNLMANHGKMITQTLAQSANMDVNNVEGAFLVFCHTDCEHDIRLLPDFVHVSKYSQRKTVHENELGSVGRFRFVVSAELAPYVDSGAAVGSTGLYSTTGTNIDVYPMIVVAQKAWGDVALRGANAIDPIMISHKVKDKADPGGQRGYVGGKLWSASVILNNGWMAVAEVGVTSL